jgi:BTB/POZ domain
MENEEIDGADYGKLWSRKEYTDLVITVGEKEFHVHRAVLAAKSQVFKDLFDNNQQVIATSKLDIQNFSEEVMGEFLRVMYSGRVEDNGNVFELFRLAGLYEGGRIEEEYRKILETNVENNWMECYGNLQEAVRLRVESRNEIQQAAKRFKRAADEMDQA